MQVNVSSKPPIQDKEKDKTQVPSSPPPPAPKPQPRIYAYNGLDEHGSASGAENNGVAKPSDKAPPKQGASTGTDPKASDAQPPAAGQGKTAGDVADARSPTLKEDGKAKPEDPQTLPAQGAETGAAPSDAPPPDVSARDQGALDASSSARPDGAGKPAQEARSQQGGNTGAEAPDAQPADEGDISRQTRSLRHSHHRVPNHGSLPSGSHPSPTAPRLVPPGNRPVQSDAAQKPVGGESLALSAQRFLGAQTPHERPLVSLAPGLADKVPYFPPAELQQLMDPKAPMNLPEPVALAWFNNLDDKYRQTAGYWKKPGAMESLRSNIKSNFAAGMNAQMADGSLSAEGRELALAASFRSNPGSLDAYKSFGASPMVSNAEARIPHLEVANWSINGRTSNEIVRVRDSETQRNLLYVPGQSKPFFEFASNEDIGKWASQVVKKGGAHAFDPYFSVSDRVPTEVPTQPQLQPRKAVSELLEENAEAIGRSAPGNIDWARSHVDDRNTDFMTKSAIMMREASLQDTKKVRGAVLEKMRTTYPDFRRHQLDELQKQQAELDPDDVRVATRLHGKSSGASAVPAGPNAAYINAQRRINQWAGKLAATQDPDLRKVSNESMDAAVAEFKRAGQKMDPVQLARRANDKDNTDELARQLGEYKKGDLNLEFSRPVQIVRKEQHLREDGASPGRLSERQKLARQREVLDDVRRLSTANVGTAYLDVGDRAWESAAVSATMKKEETGESEDITKTATHALMFQRAFDASGGDRVKEMDALASALDLSPEHRREVEKLWKPGKTEPTRQNYAHDRHVEAEAQGIAIKLIASSLMESDERLIPLAMGYNKYFRKESGRDGAFERELKLKETVDELEGIPNASLFANVRDEDMRRARQAFKATVKGPVRPTSAEFLERAQEFAMHRELQKIEGRNRIDDVKKVPIEHAFGIRTDYSNYSFKDFTKSLSESLDNPLGEFSAEIMRAKGYSPQDIEKAKALGASIVNGIELAGIAPALPGGSLFAIRPIAAAIAKFIHRRVSSDGPYSTQTFKDDVSDVGSLVFNLIALNTGKIDFKFDRNPYMRLGP